MIGNRISCILCAKDVSGFSLRMMANLPDKKHQRAPHLVSNVFGTFHFNFHFKFSREINADRMSYHSVMRLKFNAESLHISSSHAPLVSMLQWNHRSGTQSLFRLRSLDQKHRAVISNCSHVIWGLRSCLQTEGNSDGLGGRRTPIVP